MKIHTYICRILFICLAISMLAAVASAASPEEKRQSIRNMAEETLGNLYRVHPSAQGAVERSAGYAVFRNYGIKFVLIGGGKGSGLAVNNYTGQEVFMKMAEVQAGLGLGIKKFSVVFVFDSEEALDRFVNKGWEFGGQATAAATDGVNGDAYQGAVSVSPGVWMYQLTNKGLALEITGKGTRYYKDGELN